MREKHRVVDSKFGLTDFELKVIRSIAEGRDTIQTGVLLDRSPHTVRDHVSSVFKKMGVHHQATMVLKAERAGLLEGVQV